MVTATTHCPFCAMQCSLSLDGEQVVGDQTFPTNRGLLCSKGFQAASVLTDPGRLKTPLIARADGIHAVADWDDALDEVAARLLTIRQQHGPGAVGVLGSGSLTNEKAYLLGKFARVALRTPHIDYNGRFCMASAATANRRAFGIDRGLPFPISDISRADVLVLWGANVLETMPPLRQYLDEQRASGGRLIVVDPRRSLTAELADIHLQPVIGSDLALATGLLARVVRSGMVDDEFVAKRTLGFEAVRRAALAYPPLHFERRTGIADADLQRTVDAFADAETVMVLTGRGPEQHASGTDTVSAIINLLLALGQFGRPGAGYGCITGQANGQGGREHGQKADQLPGYRSITDPAARSHVARVWGVNPDDLPGAGRSAVELLDSIGTPNGIRALVVVGTNPAVGAPDANAVRARLDQLDLLVVLDSVPTDTTDRAHVVLPVALWAEEDGSTTNLEGRVLRRVALRPPPPGVRTDLEVLVDLADRLGAGAQFFSADPKVIFDELRRASSGGAADYMGITYERIEREQGVFWPVTDPDGPDTPRLFADRFAHPDGLARFEPVRDRRPTEMPDTDFPLWLTTGRVREHFNSGAQTRRIGALTGSSPEPAATIHPVTAATLGLRNGSLGVVATRRGTIILPVDTDPGIRPDTVFIPFHWGRALAANLLTSAELDPHSRMPEFKACACRVSVAATPGGAA